MKKVSFVIAVALLGVMFGCKDDPKEPPVPILSLVAPTADIDLNQTPSVVFSWKVEGGEITGGYTLYLSAGADVSNPATFTETSTSRTFTAANLDAALGSSNLGWAAGESKTLFWTVKPSSGTQKATLPEPASLSVKRITIPPPAITLQLPAEGVAVNAATYAFPLTFQWMQAPEIAAYTLKISTASNFPAAATVQYDLDNAAAKALDPEEFDALLEGFEVDYEAAITLYWTVAPTDESIEYSADTRTLNATRKPAGTIVLTAPADAKEIDAEADFLERVDLPLSLTWEKLAQVSDYTLKFSTDETFASNVVPFAMGDAAKKVLTEEAFDDLLEELGIAYGATDDIYWTVEPSTAPETTVRTQVRRISTKRWSNTVMVGTFAGSGTDLTSSTMPPTWSIPSQAATVQEQTVNEYTSGSLGNLKTAHLHRPSYMAFDDEGNMFVVMREAGQILGIVKINEAKNTVEVVFIRVLYSATDAAVYQQFTPNDIAYDAAHNRFIIATETLSTFEHFYTLDKNPSGGWDFHTRKMTLANREGLPATATNAPYFVDESGSVSSAGGGKHNLVINGNYMYGHINTYFFKADLENFAAEILTTAANTIRTGGTKHLAFNPKNSDELYFSAYHHIDNMGLSKFDIASTTFTHLSAAISGDGDVNGPLSGARFTRPRTIIFDKTGDNLYVISDRSVIKKVDMNTSTVSTLAGSTNVQQYLDGEGSVAKFNYCIGGCLSPGGKILYIGDVLNQRIRKIRLVQP